MKFIHNLKRNLLFVGLISTLTLFTPGIAKDFPTKPVEIIVAFSAGGSNDILGRALAKTSEKLLGQKVIVENRTGGGGSVGQTVGANAKPDGYTLTLLTPSVVSNPLFNKLTYDHTSFTPIILLNNAPLYLVINTKGRYKTIEDFVSYAKENPGKVSIGASGAQTTTAMAGKALAKELDLKIRHIPHNGSADAILAVQGNHIDAVVVSFAEFKAQMEGGELAAILTLSGEKRNKDTPDVPTTLEKNIDVNFSSWRGIAAPKDTDKEIIAYLHDVFKQAIDSDEYKTIMDTAGLNIDYADPVEFQKMFDDTYKVYTSAMSEK